MSNFTLYVHVGSGKAGSSAIQKALLQHSEDLKSKKVKYLGLMLEHLEDSGQAWQRVYGWPIMNKKKQKYQSAFMDVLTEGLSTCREQGYESAVISNESFFTQFDFLQKIADVCDALNVELKVIAYFRNQVSWMVSAYKQWGIKHKTYPGVVKSFDTWAKERPLNFSRVAYKWRTQCAENFIIKNYDAERELVKNFLLTCNVDISEIDLKEASINKTPDNLALSLWAYYNSQFEGEVLPGELEPVLKRSGVADKEIKKIDYNDLIPNDNEVGWLYEEYAEDLKQLNEELSLAGEKALEFPEKTSMFAHVSKDELIAALLMIVTKHDAEIRQLRNKLKNS